MKKRKKRRLTTLVVVFFLVLILLGIILFQDFISKDESIISRQFSSTIVNAGDIVTVTLDVSIDSSEAYYVIEEYVPDMWSVVDGGGGIANNANILKWAVIQDVDDATYVYTVKAPSQTGSYNFDGVYMFEGFNEQESIKGKTIVSVK